MLFIATQVARAAGGSPLGNRKNRLRIPIDKAPCRCNAVDLYESGAGMNSSRQNTLPLIEASTPSHETKTMRFEKRNFMGIELDVLVGHPEHDLLFVATQVARAAGLKNPKNLTQAFKAAAGTTQMKEVRSKVPNFGTYELHRILGKRYGDAWLFPEAVVYQMLLRGHAPASENFRKWVTDKVLPTIRKTGKYDAEQSTNPIAQGVWRLFESGLT